MMVICRSFHPVIIAILFVKAVEFGALAGILALTVAAVDSLGKIFTKAIEEISPKQVEAIRARGAPFMSVIAYDVLPQVFSRFIGFASYELDSNLRNSTLVGIVGARGVGMVLDNTMNLFSWGHVAMVLIAILGVLVPVQIAVTYICKRII